METDDNIGNKMITMVINWVTEDNSYKPALCYFGMFENIQRRRTSWNKPTKTGEN